MGPSFPATVQPGGEFRIPEDVLPSSSAFLILKNLYSKQIFFFSDLLFLFSML